MFELLKNVTCSGSKPRFVFSLTGLEFDVSVVDFYAYEWISHHFSVKITLATLSEIESVSELIGTEGSLAIGNIGVLSAGEPRIFHGVIREAEALGTNGDYYLYSVEIVPFLWKLSLRKNNRIFQEITVQEVVTKLLDESGITSDLYEFRLADSARKRGFCVQYQETDLDFINRLLEEEGIFYFFDHEPARHKIIFADSAAAHAAIPGGPTIEFNPGGMLAEKECVSTFSAADRMTSGEFTHRNFFFKKPALDLTKQVSESPEERLEIYEYPSLHVTQERGDMLAKVRYEEMTGLRKQGSGVTSSSRLQPGYKFALVKHPSHVLNAEYLILDVVHSGSQPQVLEEHGSGGCSYSAQFTVIPASVPFRPKRTAEKPHVRGMQTATVVGPEGEEIYTDEYGRIKVQFHWDREGTRNENSSCWLRYGQLWGGGGWGTVFTPRVGDEVLVDFLEGDPDRPIVIGSVYNEANRPLYPLPASKTVSTIKTRSYPKGSPDNFHELRFEDKKGSEEIYLQSEKDWNILVKNDKGQTVGHDETLHVKNNRTKVVGNDQVVNVGVNHTETIGRNKTEFVTINKAETIGVAKELSIGGIYQITVGAAMNETVGAAKAEEVGLSKSVLVGSHMSERVIGNRNISVGSSFATTVTNQNSVAAKTIIHEASEEIVLRSGLASISLKSNGEIVISGGKITIKGSGDIAIKGPNVAIN